MQVKTVGDLGRLIREARTRAGLTQTALARRFGATQSWISEVENGKETAELGKVLKMLSFLGLKLDLSDGNNRRLDHRTAQPEDDYPDIDDIVDAGPNQI